MKRLLGIGFFIICLVCVFGFSVNAAPEDRGYSPLEQAIYDGLYAHQTNINLSAYTPTSEELSDAFQYVYYTSAELFYVEIDSSYSVSKNSADRVIRFVPPYNNMTDAEIAQGSVVVTESIARIVAGVDPTWSDLEKALYAHDYLALYYDYDQSLAIRDVHTFFTQGKGVCAAYAVSYYAVMEALGIPVDVVTSNELLHIWNVVQIDGAWYHVDVTFDDPLSIDEMGCVSHEHFLKSTAKFISDQHHNASDWMINVVCSSALYDNAFWNKVESPFCYVADTWYYLDGADNYEKTAIYSYDFSTATAAKIKDVNYRWTVGKTSYYATSFSKLGMYKDKLYFTTPKAIMMYDPTIDETQEVYALIGTQVGSIYNFIVRENVAYYVTNTQATDSTHPVTGRYSRTLINRYTVQFLDTEGGEVLFSVSVDAGDTVIPPVYTQKIENHKIYPFLKWEGYAPGEAITGNRSFVAVYDMENVTDILYTYTFYDEDGSTVLLQRSAPYGTVITPPSPPEKAPDHLWRYRFAGWNGYTEGMTLEQEISFTARYTKQSIVTAVPPPATERPSTSTTEQEVPTGEGSVILGGSDDTQNTTQGGEPSNPFEEGEADKKSDDAEGSPLTSPIVWGTVITVGIAVGAPTLLVLAEKGKRKPK